MMVFRFACQHVGRTNNSPYAKTQRFIRVAEIRKEDVVTNPAPCPDCKTMEVAANAV